MKIQMHIKLDKKSRLALEEATAVINKLVSGEKREGSVQEATKKEAQQVLDDALANLSFDKKLKTTADDTLKSRSNYMTHAVFEGQDDKWRSAAVDSDGRAHLYSCHSSQLSVEDGIYKRPMLSVSFKLLDGFFDTDGWKNSSIDRPLPAKSKNKILKLGNWVFIGEDDKWRSAAVDADGSVTLYNCFAKYLSIHKGIFVPPLFTDHKKICGKFSADGWRDSPIDRAKNLTENPSELFGESTDDDYLEKRENFEAAVLNDKQLHQPKGGA